ncbi:MAG TPA: metallophosphoesterase [Candidatus Limnocylindria bacterium]|nr:metallophosphoesterase [Candidatus Limnocylindria bacterium]
MPARGAGVRLSAWRVSAGLRHVGLLLAVPLLFGSSTIATGDEARWPSSPSKVFVGAGDIAYCDHDGDDRTAALLDEIEGAVFTIGDNSQNEGTHQQFHDCFEPGWGRHKWRTRPAVGNHDRLTAGAQGYFDYFGEAAGPAGRGYYSYEVGDWRIVTLDSNCDYVGGCHAGSEQERWLRAELAANPAPCTLAIWHHPLFNSGDVGEHPQVRDLWIALEEAGADIVLNGHDHHYERFARQDAYGQRSQTGMRQFIVGTGGATPHGVGVASPNSELFRIGSLGLLKFELRPNSYTWEFISTPGDSFTDRGWDVCY